MRSVHGFFLRQTKVLYCFLGRGGLTDLYIKVFYNELTLFLYSWIFFAQLIYFLLFEITVVFLVG